MSWHKNYKIVSFYTPDYEGHAKGLISSIERHLPKVPYEIDAVSRMSWQGATNFKGHFMAKKMKKTDRPLLWIDVDAYVTGPDLLMPNADFAIYGRFADRLRHRWSPFRTGTVYFGQEQAAQDLVRGWKALCGPQSDTDQWALWKAWLSAMSDGGMPSTVFLPLSYCQKAGERGSEDPKIVHTMASRRVKDKEAIK